jgi:hypothetical protein
MSMEAVYTEFCCKCACPHGTAEEMMECLQDNSPPRFSREAAQYWLDMYMPKAKGAAQ